MQTESPLASHDDASLAERISDPRGLEIAQAICRKSVSFSEQFSARYAEKWLQSPDSERVKQLSLRAAELFAEAHGGIEGSLYWSDFPAAVVRTGDGKLFAELWLNYLHFDTTDARALLADLDGLRDRVDIYLRPHGSGNTGGGQWNAERQVCIRGLTDVYRGLIVMLGAEEKARTEEARTKQASTEARTDADDAPSKRYALGLKELRRQLDAAERTYRAFIGPHADNTYLSGSLLGFLGVAAVIGLVTLVLTLIHARGPWVAVLAAGALGAVLSVWMRLTFSNLQIDPEANPAALRIAGASRPLVGAVSALAVYVLVQGGLVPLDMPADASKRRFFLVGVAFLAGFSERLARDAFSRSSESV